MPSFSKVSKDRLSTADVKLQDICNEAIKTMDFSVLCGHRDKVAQDLAYAQGTSKLRWPKSKHNTSPSKAVDLAPWPINWNDIGRFMKLADLVLAIAKKKKIKIRWGADWNRNGQWQDEKFRDWPHFELDE